MPDGGVFVKFRTATTQKINSFTFSQIITVDLQLSTQGTRTLK